MQIELNQLEDVVEESLEDSLMEDITGQVFGNWKVIKRIKNKRYIIQCKCGKTRESSKCSIGTTSSCLKCFKKDNPDGFPRY